MAGIEKEYGAPSADWSALCSDAMAKRKDLALNVALRGFQGKATRCNGYSTGWLCHRKALHKGKHRAWMSDGELKTW